jgi:hypothetical protein
VSATEPVFLTRIARIATREPIRPVKVESPHPLEPRDAYRERVDVGDARVGATRGRPLISPSVDVAPPGDRVEANRERTSTNTVTRTGTVTPSITIASQTHYRTASTTV